MLAIIFIAGGFLLYFLAGSIAYSLLRQPIGNGNFSWPADEIRQTAWLIRGFAALLVIGGYAERILAALRSR